MSTIDDKLTQLNTVKGRLMSVINSKLNDDDPKISVNTAFGEYADFIDTYLTRAEDVTYTVTFMNGSTEVGKIENIAPGTQSITTLSFSGTNTGYSNDGHWYEGNTQKCVFGGEYGPINSNKTLSVKWIANTYTVSYNIDEGSGTRPGNLSINYNQTKTLATYNGTKTDSQTGITYQANGWRKTYGTQKDYTNGGSYKQEDAHDIELTVIWQEVQPQETYYYFLGNENPTNINQFNSFSTSETMATVSQGASTYQYLYVIIPSNNHLTVTIMSGLESTICDTGCGNPDIFECSQCQITGTPAGYKVMAYYSVNPITQNTGDYTKIIIQ